MSMQTGNKGFFAAHYDWVVLAIGVLALAGGAAFYVMSIGADPEEAAQESAREVAGMKPAKTGVKDVDMEAMNTATKLTENPITTAEVGEKTESFLASERRVLCKCKKAISGNVKAFPKCPYCGEKQAEEPVIVLDADGDGMADEWEKKHGLNPNSAADAGEDPDGDGFTNLEEYKAKTDPNDKASHPDYLDSLKIVLPLKETYMPFVFTKATKIPAGWRCEFFSAKEKNDYGRMGRTTTAIVGEQIGKTEFVLKSYEKKEAKRAIKGAAGMTKTVDVSEVVLERKSDGKKMTLVLAASKKEKPLPVDVQATLAYERGEVKNFEAVPGTELNLSGAKYKVLEVKAVGKGAKMTVSNEAGEKRTLEALEQ